MGARDEATYVATPPQINSGTHIVPALCCKQCNINNHALDKHRPVRRCLVVAVFACAALVALSSVDEEFTDGHLRR